MSNKFQRGLAMCAILLVPLELRAAERSQEPVTLEVLERLRAGNPQAPESIVVHGYDAEGRPFGEVLPKPRWTDAVSRLDRAFAVPMCVEYEPGNGNDTLLEAYRIHQDQRLLDALDGLENASGGQVVWRLLEGRVVITGHGQAVAAGTATLDRDVEVDLHASTLAEALQRLEGIYNTHYDAMPIIVSTMCLDFKADTVGFPRAEGGALRLAGRMKMRDALIATLAATGDPWMTYSMSRWPGGDRPDSYLWIQITTKPCRDMFETLEDRESTFENSGARSARRADYQAAIDARRAAREALTEAGGSGAGLEVE